MLVFDIIDIMKIHRFYIKDKSYTLGAEVLKVKDKDILHQAYNVLRLKGGEQVSLFSGLDGFDYFYNIKDINKKELFLSFTKKESGITLGTELFPKVNVYISIIKILKLNFFVYL